MLAALAVGCVYGIPLSDLAVAAKDVPQVRGRLEQVSNALQLSIYIDYAHKEAALRVVLEALRPLCRGQLIVVFGCGGNRDRAKRPRMAMACEELSDFTIVTSDNPRQERPEDICQEIIQGFSSKARFSVELDRRQAIAKAIQAAGTEDIILIAGKGHEEEQVFAHGTLPFDDRQIVSQVCAEQLTY
jgi:UDP-N-acetylmuramoyl-L-alanyl-D-glutamate--2,6-diaminopimelate ligase